MTRVLRPLVAVTAPVLLTWAVLAAAQQASDAVRATPRRSASPACLLVDLASDRPLLLEGRSLIRTSVLPGSVAKFVTLAAALESRVVTPASRFACRGSVEVDGRTIRCSHPALGRALTLTEALAHSCNDAFASIGSRLRRESFDRALVSLRLPPSDPAVPMATTALGLGGVRATPEQWLSAFVRLTTGRPAGLSDATRRVVIDGLAGAAEFGTASALGRQGIHALAKTGTVAMASGRSLGLVVAVAPADRPTRGIVVALPGGSGADAAAVAAERLAAPVGEPPSPSLTGQARALRIGRPTPAGGYAVETIDLEEYAGRVVAAEAAPRSGPEALKALAVTARTFALATRGRHEADGFDLCTLTHCQVMGTATVASRQAVEATRGLVLTDGHSVARIFYSASCGGQSDRPSAVWPAASDVPYLVSRREPECRDASRWQSEIRASDLVRALRASGARGDTIRGLTVVERTPAGRAKRLEIDGFEPRVIEGEAFRLLVGRALGWSLLKSTAFDVTRTAAGYRFDGRGAGHGVGLCVTGSARLARSGAPWRAILGAYFPGAKVEALGLARVPRVELRLPVAEEHERSATLDRVDDAVRSLGTRFGLAPPTSLLIVFHPTVEAYTRATGRGWWTAGATRGERIDLLPPAVLRQRGNFDRTVMHEIAHVMTAQRLADRPVWVREAAAMFLCGEIDGRGAAERMRQAPCPADREMLHPASAEAMRDAYDRAAACFARQLTSGRHWDGVR